MNRTLSHSQIEMFTGCPRRWYLTKIARVPQAPSEHLILGDAFHHSIEKDGQRIRDGRTPHTGLDLRDIFTTALHARLTSDDPSGLLPHAMRLAMHTRGVEMLSAYTTYMRPHYRPVDVETPFEHAIPGLPGWRFTGRIDARTQAATSSTIVDLKTASRPWRPGAEHEDSHGDQAAAYLWASTIANWQPPAKRVTFVVFSGAGKPQWLQTPRVADQTPQYIAHRINTYAETVRTTARQIEAAIQSNDFPANPGKLFGASSQCRWCGVLGHCETGRAWLRTHGQTPAVPVVSVATVKQTA